MEDDACEMLLFPSRRCGCASHTIRFERVMHMYSAVLTIQLEKTGPLIICVETAPSLHFASHTEGLAMGREGDVQQQYDSDIQAALAWCWPSALTRVLIHINVEAARSFGIASATTVAVTAGFIIQAIPFPSFCTKFKLCSNYFFSLWSADQKCCCRFFLRIW